MPPSGQTTDKPFACLRCWKLKKSCNKELPQCQRCVAAGNACVYSSDSPTDREALLRTSQRPSHGAASPESWDQKKTLPSLFNRSLTAPPSPPDSEKEGSERSYSHRPSEVTWTVYSAYGQIKHELKEILPLFSLTLNTWLPIIPEAQLKHLSTLEESTPDLETSALLLSIYLVTKEPPQDGSLETIYTVVKGVHSTLHTTTAHPIPIIQIGMLLALYEQGQAIHRVAFMTIGAAVRLAQLEGYHKSISINLDQRDVEKQEQLRLQRHVWWLLVVVERILALQCLNEIVPFTAASPEVTDYLPSTLSPNGNPDGANPVGIMTYSPSGEADVQLPYTNPFGESVQAVFIMSKVFEHINVTNLSPLQRAKDVELIDGLLHRSIEQAMLDLRRQTRTWHECCSAFFICLFSRLRLHIHNLEQATSLESQISRQRSLIALFHIAAMGSQSKTTAQDLGQDAFMKEENMPAFILHSGRDAALLSLKMLKYPEEGAGDAAFWKGVLEFYRASFDIGRRKWRLADEYAAIVRTKEQELSR